MTKPTKAYRAWLGMKTRCCNPNYDCYHNYGGRGIKVYEGWLHDFHAFLRDMGEPPTAKHSLDRIDVNGDYTPGNCRWASAKEQNRNARSNIYIEAFGVRALVADWAAAIGIPYDTLKSRIRLGWPDEKIVTEPPALRRSR